MQICSNCNELIKRNFNKHKKRCLLKKKKIIIKEKKKKWKIFSNNINLPKLTKEIVDIQYDKWKNKIEKLSNSKPVSYSIRPVRKR